MLTAPIPSTTQVLLSFTLYEVVGLATKLLWNVLYSNHNDTCPLLKNSSPEEAWTLSEYTSTIYHETIICYRCVHLCSNVDIGIGNICKHTCATIPECLEKHIYFVFLSQKRTKRTLPCIYLIFSFSFLFSWSFDKRFALFLTFSNNICISWKFSLASFGIHLKCVLAYWWWNTAYFVTCSFSLTM